MFVQHHEPHAVVVEVFARKLFVFSVGVEWQLEMGFAGLLIELSGVFEVH